MMLLKLFFKNHPAINISVDNTTTGRLYFDLVKKHNSQCHPVHKDNILWTPEYLIELAKIAKKELGWDWLSDEYTLDLTTKLHKDLEYSVGKTGFQNIPEEYDWLLHDMHHCLHSVQFGKKTQARTCNLQVEWFTDDSLPLPTDFEFISEINRGDLILINPYVGHNPLQVFMENDYSDLDSTCKFHDIIKPAVVISAFSMKINKQEILDCFIQEDPEFVKKHTKEKILYYTGAAKIGQILNLDIFEDIMQSKNLLEFEKIELNHADT